MVLGLIDEIAAPDPARIFKRALGKAGIVLKDAEALIAERRAHARVRAFFEADIVKDCELGAHRCRALRPRRCERIDIIIAALTALDIFEAEDAGDRKSTRLNSSHVR